MARLVENELGTQAIVRTHRIWYISEEFAVFTRVRHIFRRIVRSVATDFALMMIVVAYSWMYCTVRYDSVSANPECDCAIRCCLLRTSLPWMRISISDGRLLFLLCMELDGECHTSILYSPHQPQGGLQYCALTLSLSPGLNHAHLPDGITFEMFS